MDLVAYGEAFIPLQQVWCIVLYRIVVRRDPSHEWKAAFSDAPLTEHSGAVPSAALWSLFKQSGDRAVDPHTLVAIEPDSETRLNFIIEGK